MNIRCIIVDDEPLAINVIKSHISKVDFIKVVAECKNALNAMEILLKENVELMFLDINMPKITGLEFLKSLPHPPYVIITTAFKDYALDSYDLDVLDYLLKPISFERFLKAINRFYERYEKTLHIQSQVEKEEKEDNTYIYVQDGKTVFKVYYNKLLYLEGFGEYVKVHTLEKTYLSRKTLQEYEYFLPKDQFLRTHKSFIVSNHQITGFTASTILIGGKEIPIGRTYKEQVMKSLDFKTRSDP